MKVLSLSLSSYLTHIYFFLKISHIGDTMQCLSSLSGIKPPRLNYAVKNGRFSFFLKVEYNIPCLYVPYCFHL